jgi:hypothetical protein
MVTRMYTVQIARLDRMYKFIIQDERFKTLDNNLQADIILSFFMHCYHLKDWLKESGVMERRWKAMSIKSANYGIAETSLIAQNTYQAGNN